ncbi:hypothetical protein Tco_0266044 [Tanacetum coccineum]
MLLIEILHDVVGTSGYHWGVLQSFLVERIEQGIRSIVLSISSPNEPKSRVFLQMPSKCIIPEKERLNNLTGRIGMYTRFIDFSNFRIPLSTFLLCVLQYYQINLSQLSVIGAAKVSHFKLMCRVLGRVPTVATFRQFYVNSISNGWFSFSKRGGVDDPCCYSKKFDSLKNWNNRFFCVDASVCPLSIPWFTGTSVIKYPIHVDEVVDLPCLSRSFIEFDVLPNFLHNNDKEMGLLDFVKSTNPYKVKVGERTLAETEVPLLNETEDRVISPSSPTALKMLELQSGPEGTGSGSVPHPSEEFVSSSITPTPEPAIPEDFGSNQDVNVHTRPVSERFVIATSSSKRGDADISLRVKSPLPHVEAGNIGVGFIEGVKASSVPGDDTRTFTFAPSEGSPVDEFYESQTIDSATAQDVYVPEWSLTNDARVDNPGLCCNLLDHITPLHVCMVSELRLRYEHEIMSRERFHKKFTESSMVIRQRNAEIVALKAKLEAAEKESTKVTRLHGRMSELETEDSAARHFDERAAELVARIADVMRDMDNNLYPHMLTAIARQRWVLGHGIRLAVMKCAQSSECRSSLGKVIYFAINKVIQQGLEDGVKHGKAGRSLAQVEAYDLDVEKKYVAAVNDFENVSFSLLKLEALKDSSLALSMSALTFEGDAHSTPKLCELQPSLDQVTIPVYSESSGLRGSSFIGHEMLFSAVGGVVGVVPIYGSSLGVADYQVSTLVHTGDTVPVA